LALGDIGDQRALEPLISAYRARGSLTTLGAIAYLGDPRAAPFLELVLRSTSDRMHKHAAEHGLALLDLLGDIDPAGALLAALPSLSQRSQIWAIGHLVPLNDGRTIDALCRLASDGQRSEELRICAAAALATFGARAAPQIRNLARADDVFARVLGGLAAHHVDDPILLPTSANAGVIETDRFVKACLALVNDGEPNSIERRR
jgi:HEAT repeat protein